MQLILRENVENLGKSGDLVTVRDGYGRNYLLPQGLAALATAKNVARIEHDKKQILARAEKVTQEASRRAEAISALTLTIAAAVGEEGKLFGSVTAKDVESALREQGVDVSRKALTLPEGEPIRALGVYTIDVKLHAEVSAKLKVWVVAK
ncbi:MAG: 50S ribosomal protein L9 [Myxococcota bacterium]